MLPRTLIAAGAIMYSAARERGNGSGDVKYRDISQLSVWLAFRSRRTLGNGIGNGEQAVAAVDSGLGLEGGEGVTEGLVADAELLS